MKVFLDENFNIKSVTDDVGDVIVRGSNSFDKLYVYVPTSVISDYTTINPLYAVKRADGRELGKYATLTNHATDGDAVDGYYGWYGFFNKRDICVAGALEITISFSLVKSGITSEKNVCKVTVNVKDGVMVDNDVLILNDSNWVSLKTSIETLATNLANKADRTNSQQTITADTINASEASILELTSNLIEVISAIITNLTVSGNITTGNIGATTINGTTIKQDNNAVLDVRDIVDSFISESTTKALSAKKGNELKYLVDTKVARADVVNNLTDTSINKPLSAKMGKYLKDEIDYINSLLQSDDTTLDELQEIVAYIKNNKSLIDGITTSKVSISDIIDNLNSNDTNKPLSAKQGHVLKGLIDNLQTAINNTYTKSETDDLLDDKADKSTTYTKDDVDDELVLKQNITIPTITIAGVNYTNLEQAIGALNAYAQTIEQVIGSISGTDTTIVTRLTQLETNLSNLNTAWNNFTTGTSADSIVNTLIEIQQELALLDSSRTNIIELSSLTLTQAQYDSINEYTIISYNNDMYRYSHTTQPTSTTYHYFYTVTTDYIANLIVNSGLTATNYKTNWQKASNLITSWSSTPSNTKYPSEKLVKDSLDTKVDKITGKGLSTNDFTDADKADINKSLYHLGRFDTISGNTITRQTGYVDLGSLDWVFNTDYFAVPNFTSDYGGESYADNQVANIICSRYQTKSALDVSSSGLGISITGWNAIYVKDSNYTDVTSFKASLQGVILQYKLATSYTDTPIEGESILPLDSNMAQMIRQDVVEALNLYDYAKVISNLGGTITINGNNISLTNNDSYGDFWLSEQLQANTTYTISFSNVTNISNVRLFDTIGGTVLEILNISTVITFTTPSNCYLRIWVGDNTTFTGSITLNKGNHPYPHEPYHANKHITDDEAKLLKQEEEKCRNLLPNSKGISGSSQTVLTEVVNLPIGTYTIKASGGTYSGAMAINVVYADGTSGGNIVAGNVGTALTFTTTKVITQFSIYCNSTISNVNFMLNEGSTPEPHQEWNGEIVHEKQLRDLEPVSLFENPDPSADFTTATYGGYSFSNYKYVIIEWKYSRYWYGAKIEKVRLDDSKITKVLLSDSNQYDETIASRELEFDKANGTVKVGKGYMNGSADDGYIIPLALYGTNIL